MTDPEGGFLPGVLRVGVDNSSLELQIKLEYAAMLALWRIGDLVLCRVSTNQPHYLPVDLHRVQISHIDNRSLPIWSQEAQENATLNFQMHLRVTPTTQRVLEKFRLSRGHLTSFLARCVAHLLRNLLENLRRR